MEEVARLEVPGNTPVWHVQWNPTGTLFTSCSGPDVLIWGLEGSQWVRKSSIDSAHQRTVRAVDWHPSGKSLATASFDATVCVWEKDDDGGDYECAATLEGHENEVKSVAWYPGTGNLLATCGRDKSVWIWEADEDDYECVSVLHEHTQDVKRVVWHPHEEMLASCSYDDTIKLYRDDSDDWTSFATLRGHESTVWAIAWDADGSRLASCSADHTVRIWKRYNPGNPQGVETNGVDPTFKCVCTIAGHHDRPIYDIAWSSESGLLATAAGDNSICIYRETPGSDEHAPSFELLHKESQAHNQDVNSLRWSPADGTLLASGGDDGWVKLWRIKGL